MTQLEPRPSPESSPSPEITFQPPSDHIELGDRVQLIHTSMHGVGIVTRLSPDRQYAMVAYRKYPELPISPTSKIESSYYRRTHAIINLQLMEQP